MEISIIYSTYKMNIKATLFEEYINYVDDTKKQNKYFKLYLSLFVIIIALFLFYLFFKYNSK